MSTFRLCLATAALPLLCVAEFPEARISNRTVTARLYLPNAEQGYYRGTRFDWSGVISSLKVNGHEYFGQWFDKYDPKLHDAIMGPVEEFLTSDSTLGYDEAAPGGTFIRIGVGVLRKPDNGKFQRFKTYEIVDPGRWTVRPDDDKIEFIHELNDAGYGYRYKKVIRLPGRKPEMIIEHELKNTGTKPIATMQYNHNFFVFDNNTTGPGTSVQFPFTLKPRQPLNPQYASLTGGKIEYLQELPKGQSVFSEFEGFGSTEKDFDVRIESRKAGSGVRIQGDRPIAKLIFWSIRSTVCPEPYINIAVDPGQETQWTYHYTFYDLGKQ